MKRLLPALLIALACLFPAPGTVRGHAILVRSDPPLGAVLQQPPRQVQLWFSEPVEPGFSSVQVLDPSRRRVDAGDSRVAPGDPASMVVSLQPVEEGIYSVAWNALSSVDGHVTRGVFTLSVGVAASDAMLTAPAELSELTPWEAVARAGGYIAIVALLGALFFRQRVLLPAARAAGLGTAGPAPGGPGAGGMQSREAPGDAPFPLPRRLFSASWALLLISVLGGLAVQYALVVSPASGSFVQFLFGTRYGAVWLARFALIVALGLLVLGPGPRRPTEVWLALLAGCGVLLSTGLNSHSAAVADLPALAVAADFLHQAAVAVWVGGLFSLAVTLPGYLSGLGPERRLPLLAGVISRFSRLATVSVGVLIATGVYEAWLHVGYWEGLIRTLYGEALLVKLAVVAPLLLLGGFNLLVLKPRLAAAAGPQGPPASPEAAVSAGRLGGTLRAEAVLGAMVLLAAGLLTSLPPARQTFEQVLASRPLVMSAPAGNLQVTLTFAPPRPGQGTFVADVRGPGEAEVPGARVLLTFTYLEEALGSTTEIAEPQRGGLHQAPGAAVAVEGIWQVEVIVQQPGQEDARTAFRFWLTPQGAQEIGSRAGAGFQLPELGYLTLAGFGLMAMGVALIIYVRRNTGIRSSEGVVLTIASLAVIGVGMFVAVRSVPTGAVTAGDPRGVMNPMAPTQESLTIGEQVYRSYGCDTCHGVQGRGDGPAAAGLRPRPADFRVHMAAGHTDGELFDWISNGVQGTAMGPYRNQLTEEQRWHVINFIKTFAVPAG